MPRLGVALEVEVNTNRSALLFNAKANNGTPIELRQAINDMRGAVSELLGKAINHGAVDQELSATDRERMLAFLRDYGDLTPGLFYQGSTRSGYQALPGPEEVWHSPQTGAACDLARSRYVDGRAV